MSDSIGQTVLQTVPNKTWDTVSKFLPEYCNDHNQQQFLSTVVLERCHAIVIPIVKSQLADEGTTPPQPFYGPFLGPLG